MNKHKITCDICMDLIPLVKDGIASEDSKEAVEEHVAECERCKMFYSGEGVPVPNWEKSFNKFVQKTRFWFILILMFGISFGLSLTAGQEMFYNSVLMPVVGVLGYVVFRWKAAYLVPVLMFVTDFLSWLLAVLRGVDGLSILDSLIYTLIYCIFVWIGVVLAGLVHWCISRGSAKQKAAKIAGMVAALAVFLGICIFANALVGNPVSRMLAKNTAEKYLKEQYAGTDYALTELGFNFKNTDYYAHIKSESSPDTYFSLNIDMFGKLIYDNYEDSVVNGGNTARRLSAEYRALTDTVLEAADFPYRSEQNIGFGDLLIESVEWGSEIDSEHILMMEDFELDGVYDVGELGRQAGELTLHIDDETVTPERAAEMLLEIKRLFEEKNIGVYCVDFMLRKPRPAEGPREDVTVWVEDFLWSDIYEEGLAERIQAAHDKWQEELEEK